MITCEGSHKLMIEIGADKVTIVDDLSRSRQLVQPDLGR
jgi:hypothetical protein